MAVKGTDWLNKTKADFVWLDDFANKLKDANMGVTTLGAKINAAWTNLPTASKIGLGIAGVSTAIGIIAGVVSAINNAQEKSRQATREASQALAEQAKTADEAKIKIAELKTQLDKGNLSEQEAYDVRKELLDIQDDIVDKLGEEAGAFDILKGSIDDANKSLDAWSQSSAKAFLEDNAPELAKAVNAMENSINGGNLVVFRGTAGGTDQTAIRDIFKDVFGDNAHFNYTDDGIEFSIDVNPTEAVDGLEQISAALYDLEQSGVNVAELLGTSDGIWHREFAAAKSAAQTLIDRYKENYDAYVQNTIRADGQLVELQGQIVDGQKALTEALASNDLDAIRNAYQSILSLDLSEVNNESVRKYFEQLLKDLNEVARKAEIKIELTATFADPKNTFANAVTEAVTYFANDEGQVDLTRLLSAGQDYTSNQNKNHHGHGDYLSADEKAFLAVKNAADKAEMSVEEYVRYLAEMGVVTLQVAKNTDKLVGSAASLSTLDTIKSGLSSLDTAFQEMQEDGEIAFSTLTKIQDAFTWKDDDGVEHALDGLDDYIARLGAVRDDADVVTGIINEMADAFIEAQIATGDLAESDVNLIAAALKEAGVLNAEEVAANRVANAKVEATLANGDLIDSEGNLNEALLTSVGALNSEADAAAWSAIQTQYAALQASILNGQPIDMSSAIKSLSGLSGQSKTTAAALQALIAIFNKVSAMDATVDRYAQQVKDSVGRSAQRAANQLAAAQARRDGFDYAAAFQAEFTKALTEIEIPVSWSPYTPSSGSSFSTEKTLAEQIKEQFDLEKDALDAQLTLLKHQYDELVRGGKLDEAQANLAQQADLYWQIREAASSAADAARALGLTEQEVLELGLSDEWWQSLEDERSTLSDFYNQLQSIRENAVTLNENWLENAQKNGDRAGIGEYAGNIVAQYRAMQNELHALADQYRAQGYADTSNEVSALSDKWWELEHIIEGYIENAYQTYVDTLSDAVDDIQSVYDTLHKAADEYAANGFISIDTWQSIVSMGTKYLAYLRDENGQLVINEENIRKVIAARVDELAVEEALNYVEFLRLALADNDTQKLNNLLYATENLTGSTWDLVYAQLAMLDLNGDQYQAALHNINALRSMAESAKQSIGQVTNSVSDSLSKMKSGLSDILDYIMSMIKQRVQDEIDALNDAKDAYADLIQAKKDSLQASKDEANYQKNVASKLKEIAKLQAKISALDLDNSRDAQAKKAALLEQMAELQDELATTQADRADELAEESLDNQLKAYEDMTKEQVAILEDSISSTEKIYQKAMGYLRNDIGNDYERLMSDLIEWNYRCGNTLQSALEEAWSGALAAFQQYESAVATYEAYNAGAFDSPASGSTYQVGNTNQSKSSNSTEIARANIISQMKANSKAWHTASESDKAALSAANISLASQLSTLLGQTITRDDDGYWRYANGSRVYAQGGVSKFTGPAWMDGTPTHPEVTYNYTDAEKIYDLVHTTPDLVADFMERMKRAVIPTVFGSVGSLDRLSPSLTGIEPGNVSINIGDTIINGGNEETVRQHQEVTRKFTNEILKQIGIKR